MKTMMIKCAMLAAGVWASNWSAHAQTPELPPIKIVVGFVPGGSTDNVARILAEGLRKEMKRTVLVENKPGAIGVVAAQYLHHAGNQSVNYLFSPESWAVIPTLSSTETKLKYNYFKDFRPVAKVVSYPLGLYASQGAGVKNLKEFVQKAQKDKSYQLYGSSGVGGIGEFLGVVMSKEFGIEMTNVPYKGAADVKGALIGNQIHTGVIAPGDISDLIAAGKMVPLGFMSKNRWEVMPDIPTMQEQGFNITQGEAFMGLWTTTKTPDAEIQAMEQAIQKITSQKEFTEMVKKSSLYPSYASSEQLKQQLDELFTFWRPMIAQNQK